MSKQPPKPIERRISEILSHLPEWMRCADELAEYYLHQLIYEIALNNPYARSDELAEAFTASVTRDADPRWINEGKKPL